MRSFSSFGPDKGKEKHLRPFSSGSVMFTQIFTNKARAVNI